MITQQPLKVISAYTGESLNYNYVTTNITGAPITDADCDGVIYRKFKNGLYGKLAFSGPISVREFGAKGDGVTDDTAAIQAAMNTGNDICFGNNMDIYVISKQIYLSNNQKVFSSGATIKQTAAGVPILDIVNKSNNTISGFNFVGQGNDFQPTSSSLSVGISCYGASNVLINKNKFSNFTYSSVSGLRNVSDFSFSDNIIVGLGAAWANDGTPDGRKDNTGLTVGGIRIRISNNSFSETSQGLIIAENSNAVSIYSNNIFNIALQHGMYIDAGIPNLSIVGNIVQNIPMEGIKIQNRDTLNYESYNISIIGNVVRDTLLDGISLLNASNMPVSLIANNVSIANNTVSNCGQYGISIRNAANVNVVGNIVENTTSFGIYSISNTKLIISKNNITSTGGSAILSDMPAGKYVWITDNFIFSPGIISQSSVFLQCGISISDCTEHIIHNNRIYGDGVNMVYGIFLQGGDQSTAEITNNYTEGHTGYAARFISGAAAPRLISQNVWYPTNEVAFNPTSLARGLPLCWTSDSVATAGYHVIGEIIFNTKMDFVGWICTVAGTPGTWAQFGKIDSDLDKPTSGTTSGRPTVTTLGFRYYDTTLGKPVYWNGSAWVEAEPAASTSVLGTVLKSAALTNAAPTIAAATSGAAPASYTQTFEAALVTDIANLITEVTALKTRYEELITKQQAAGIQS